MPTGTETTARLLVLLGAVALGGCDGGIFGTGDGSESVPAPDASPESTGLDADTSSTGPGDGAMDPSGVVDGGAGGDMVGTTSGDDADADATTGDGAETSSGDTVPVGSLPPSDGPLQNRVPEPGVTDERRVRLVNASAQPLALAADLGEGSANGISSGTVGSGEASAYVTLSSGAESLLVLREEGVPGTVADDVVLHRFSPLAIDPRTVTTVFVRDAAVPPDGAAQESDVDATGLPTRLASDDPSQALVRVVDDGSPADPGTGAAYTLVPDGPNPGGVEVALEGVAFGRVLAPVDTLAPGYAPVPAGDYRLEGTGGTAIGDVLSFDGGAVRTLVVSGDGGAPLEVDDTGL